MHRRSSTPRHLRRGSSSNPGVTRHLHALHVLTAPPQIRLLRTGKICPDDSCWLVEPCQHIANRAKAPSDSRLDNSTCFPAAGPALRNAKRIGKVVGLLPCVSCKCGRVQGRVCECFGLREMRSAFGSVVSCRGLVLRGNCLELFREVLPLLGQCFRAAHGMRNCRTSFQSFTAPSISGIGINM